MKLTDTQLIILSKAVQREGHAVATIDKRSATRAAFEALLKAKLLKPVPKISGTATWLSADGEGPVSLMLTPKGLKAIDGSEVERAQTDQLTPSTTRAKRKSEAFPKGAEKLVPPGVRETSKLAKLIALLKRAKGAGLDEMCGATGWRVHSVRGAISGSLKKKLGLAVTSEVEGETRIYRIPA